MNYVIIDTPADERAVLIVENITAVTKASSAQPGFGGGRHMVIVYTTSGEFKTTPKGYEKIAAALEDIGLTLSVKTQGNGKAIINTSQVVSVTREQNPDSVPTLDRRGREVIHLSNGKIIRLADTENLAESLCKLIDNKNKKEEPKNDEN